MEAKDQEEVPDAITKNGLTNRKREHLLGNAQGNEKGFLLPKWNVKKMKL
jgi:hypothetical protein